MKKLTYSIFALLFLSLFIVGCGGDSYEKRLKKEKKAISNFLNDNGIDVLHTYPDKHYFKENEYYLEPGTGVYMRVIDPGDLTNTLKIDENTPVTLRFDSVLSMVKGTYTQGNNVQGSYPMSFVYGKTSTYIDYVSNDIHTYFMSPACVLPMEKGLGYGATVSLIVPFINGSAYQISSYEPYYFPYIKYRFIKHDGGDDTSVDSEEK